MKKTNSFIRAMISILCFSVIMMAVYFISGEATATNYKTVLLATVVGALICETIIQVFKINDNLKRIADSLEKPKKNIDLNKIEEIQTESPV